METWKNPTWYPPASIRAEKPELPAIVPPGPDNPLGAFALHLGWPTALGAVALDAPSPRLGANLPPEADPYFRAQRVGGDVELDPSFAILVAIRGSGTLHSERADSVPLTRGDTVLVPFAAGRTAVGGNVELLRCLPPAPEAPEAPW